MHVDYEKLTIALNIREVLFFRVKIIMLTVIVVFQLELAAKSFIHLFSLIFYHKLMDNIFFGLIAL